MASFIVILVYHYPVHISLPLRKISTPITKVDFTNHHYISMSSSSSWDVYLGFFIITSWFWTSFLMSPPTRHNTLKLKKKAIWRIFFKKDKMQKSLFGHFKKKIKYSWLLLLFRLWKNNKGTISNFFIFWITVLLMGSPNNTFENLVFMKWWNGESFDTQKWQIHLGPPDDELIQLIFIFIMHLLMAIWWCVWLKFKNTGPLLIYIHSK